MKIQLRGHHIGTFAIHLWENNFYKREYGTSSRIIYDWVYDVINEKKPAKKYLDEYIISLENESKSHKEYFKEEIRFVNNTDLITAVYGKRMKEMVDALYKLMQIKPDLEVEIVGGLDSICKIGCPRLKSSCTQSNPDDEDDSTLRCYNLEIGKTYTARDIVQRIADFTIRTGIRSPRDIEFAKMRRGFISRQV